jgi:hypothetical protein
VVGDHLVGPAINGITLRYIQSLKGNFCAEGSCFIGGLLQSFHIPITANSNMATPTGKFQREFTANT